MINRTSQVVLCTTLAVLALAVPAGAASVTISPLPGTPAALPETQISFLGASASSLRGISVVGSRSGRHRGHLRPYASATGASFLLNKEFTPGEHVSVRAQWRIGRSIRRIGTHFKVAVPVAPPSTEFPAVAGKPSDVQNFVSEPSLHPPVVTVHQAAGAASAPGLLFAAPFLGPGQWGPMIFDNSGGLVWFKPVPPGEDAAGLQTQVFHGKNDLTWWQGKTITLGYGLGEDVIADANYRTVAVVKAGNGYPTDEHEFIVLPNDAAIVLGYSPVQQDLSSVGGAAAGAAAVNCALQEVDIHTGLVMWEWDSIGHVSLSDSYSKPPASSNGFFDYFHLNSAQALKGGNFLISARNTWGIYLINGQSGRIGWQLGGKRSTFALGAGVPFAYQHHALLLPNGNVSLFDDEGAPPVKGPSRGEIVKLDTKARTATLVSQLVRAGFVLTNSQGDTQLLPGGGWMVGFGGLPNFTEFNAQGQPIFDAQLPSGENSYRVYRLPWSGQPTTPPALVVRPGAGGATAYASWNGATTAVSWQLLAGPNPAQLSVVSTAPRAGFETAIPAPTAAAYQVRALSASGKVLATSKPVAASSG